MTEKRELGADDSDSGDRLVPRRALCAEGGEWPSSTAVVADIHHLKDARALYR
jgi:hypothetical protein